MTITGEYMDDGLPVGIFEQPLTCTRGKHWLVDTDLSRNVTVCQCGERGLPGMHTTYYQIGHYHPREYVPYGYQPRIREMTECECHPVGVSP